MPPRDPQKNRAYCRAYHALHKEEIRARKKSNPKYQETIRRINKRRYLERKTKGICVACGQNPARSGKILCQVCRERLSRSQAKHLTKLRDQIFQKYGGYRCTCCGETESRFLTIDHVNGGGNKHRRAIGIGRFYYWLRDNNFPAGFQVLCYNCNLGKSQNGGVCPHHARKYEPLPWPC